jgi:hypothetical protein
MNKIAVLACVALASILTLAPAPASACSPGDGNCVNAPGQNKGAPGPIAGAGLPFLAVGYGLYWLVKRRRKDD